MLIKYSFTSLIKINPIKTKHGYTIKLTHLLGQTRRTHTTTSYDDYTITAPTEKVIKVYRLIFYRENS
jgi:hypothetical protein